MKNNQRKYFFIVLLIFALSIGVGYFLAEQKELKQLMLEASQEVKIPAGERLNETNSVLSPAIFSGRISVAYQMATVIPWVIDKQFCYCDCKKKFKHKSLLTCFTTDHGAKCDTCINEVFEAFRLFKKGYSTQDIVAAIDKEFKRFKDADHDHE